MLLRNSRFYILTGSILASGIMFAFLRLTSVSDQLFLIRAEQTFGFISLGYWYLALIISPLGHAIGKHRTKHLEFARRAIGVSAFYYVLLHSVIALWGQLGGVGELKNLPTIFQWSLLGGAVAFFILGLMAATSLDIAVRVMTYRKWKWLHRFVYLAGVLAMLHIWTIGTHLAYTADQITVFVALVILIGLELYRVGKQLNAKYLHLDRTELLGMIIAVWVLIGAGIAFVPSLIHNYHSAHVDHSQTNSGDEMDHMHMHGGAE
jgi:DMSO/TMAO reductase YedYZ heme-binding membrane subunit